MAVPANLDSKSSFGCWRLIREGATMVTSAEEVVGEVKGEGGKVKGEGGIVKSSLEIAVKTNVGIHGCWTKPPFPYIICASFFRAVPRDSQEFGYKKRRKRGKKHAQGR